MYKLFMCTVVCLLMFVSCSEKIVEPVAQPAPSAAAMSKPTFPADWVGNWIGELGIYRGTQLLQSIPMEMTISAPDSTGRLDWKTSYKGDRPVDKPYNLLTIDKALGRYLVDENNSIKIETFLFDNKLVSWYEVQGTIIMASHELRGEELVFEILAGSDKPASVTGNTVVKGDSIPAVTTWPINVMQRGILTRKK
ncbi:MAG: hypothetical protein AAGG75_17235 [Bacteroidota bacterium]